MFQIRVIECISEADLNTYRSVWAVVLPWGG